MKLVVCIDNRGGWSFNDRRQSRDLEVNKRILQMSEHHIIYTEKNSACMLEADVLKLNPAPIVDIRSTISDPALVAQKDDIVFAESYRILDPHMDYNEVVVYIWGRSYPYDTKFPYDFQSTEKWKLHSKTQFKGLSHDTIFEEHYVPVLKKERYLHVF